MFDKLLSPLTTASSIGVAFRYLTTIAGALVALLGVLGMLTPEQVDALTKAIPELFAALGALAAAAIPLYAIVTKAFSDKAAEAAKAIDANIPSAVPVTLQTDTPIPDITIPGKA